MRIVLGLGYYVGQGRSQDWSEGEVEGGSKSCKSNVSAGGMSVAGGVTTEILLWLKDLVARLARHSGYRILGL